MDLLSACDVVWYDTMYSHDEYLTKMTWGHSYPEYAVALCRGAGVRKLMLFHHLPDATDDELDALAERWSTHTGPEVGVAREGEVITVER
jgi:ribonuclease BN (tRNA processing enzyme)